MPDLDRFIIFIAAAFLVFVSVLFFVVRKRGEKPGTASLAGLGAIVVVMGMLFARYSHIYFPHLSWMIYYGVPVMITFVLPPLWFRMSRTEVLQYVPLALLMAPFIHIFFSLFAGWHDYMPFPLYLPSVAELVRDFHFR